MSIIPVYVEITGYRATLDKIDLIKTKLLEAKRLLEEVHGLRTQENEQMYELEQQLAEMERRLRSMQEELYV